MRNHQIINCITQCPLRYNVDSEKQAHWFFCLCCTTIHTFHNPFNIYSIVCWTPLSYILGHCHGHLEVLNHTRLVGGNTNIGHWCYITIYVEFKLLADSSYWRDFSSSWWWGLKSWWEAPEHLLSVTDTSGAFWAPLVKEPSNAPVTVRERIRQQEMKWVNIPKPSLRRMPERNSNGKQSIPGWHSIRASLIQWPNTGWIMKPYTHTKFMGVVGPWDVDCLWSA